MKNQALFSSKYQSIKLQCRLLQFLFGALRVNRKTDPSSCNLKGKLICQPGLGFKQSAVCSLTMYILLLPIYIRFEYLDCAFVVLNLD